jgi:hypothetical protein
MLDQLIAAVSQKTGIPTDKAHMAVDTVVTQLKAHLPAPIAAHVDDVLAGNVQGTLADVEAKLKTQLSNTNLADVKQQLSSAQNTIGQVKDEIGKFFHKA